MAKTNEDKDRIRQEIIEFCTKATRGSSVITEHFTGEIITNEIQLKRLQRKLMKVEETAFDTEFTSLRMQYKGEQELTGVSFCFGKYENYYVAIQNLVDPKWNQIGLPKFKKYMSKFFARKDVRIIGHNLKAELHAMANAGIEVATDDLFDTLVAVWNINENDSVGLKDVTQNYYGYNQRHFEDILLTIPKEVKLDFGMKVTDKGNSSLVEIKYIAPYAMDDTFWTWQIYLDIQDALEEEGVETYFNTRQMPYLKVLTNMERRGVKVNFKRLQNMSKMAEKDLAEMEYKIFELAGIEFNVGSSQHLGEVLFGYEKQKPIYETIFEPILDPKTNEHAIYKSGARKGELKYKELKNKDKVIGYEGAGNQHLIDNSFNFPIQSTTAGGAPETGGKALEELSKKEYKRDKRKADGIKMLNYILRYKKLSKLKSTYMEGLAQQVYSDGKIHASFNQTGCLTKEAIIPTSKGMFEIGNICGNTNGEFVGKKVKIVNRYGELEDTSHIVTYINRETKRIKTSLGFEIEGTLNHPLIANYYNSKARTNNEGSCRTLGHFNTSGHWKNIEDIEVGDYVAIKYGYNLFAKDYVQLDVAELVQSKNTNSKTVNYPSVMDEKLAEFLGIYYADGSIHDNNGSYSIRITNKNEDVVDRVSELVNELFGLEVSYDSCSYKKNSTTSYITAINLKKFFTEVLPLDRVCTNKIIPDFILQSPANVVKAYIKGMTLDSSVHTESDKKIFMKFTVSNKESANQLQQVLINLGIVASIRKENSRENSYLVTVHNKEYNNFRDIIGFVESDKYVTLDVKKVNSNYINDEVNKTLWLLVKSVEFGQADVYDFTVPETHSFIANGFISHNTTSGRLSSSGPNMQNLPRPVEDVGDAPPREKFSSDEEYKNALAGWKREKDEYDFWSRYEIRDAFIPDNDNEVFMAHDYSNLEIRILTHFCQDPLLVSMFKNNADVHGQTAIDMYKLNCTDKEVKKLYPHLRQHAKVLNFLLIYGGSVMALSSSLGIGKAEGQQLYDLYFDTYKGVKTFMASQKRYAHKNEFVYTLLGRKRHLEGINAKDFGTVGYNERLSVNAPIQGSAADIAISAQIAIEYDPILKELGYRQVLQVHDEICGVCPKENAEEASKRVQYLMENCLPNPMNNIKLKVDFDFAETYAKAK